MHALYPRNRASRNGAALLLLTPEAHDEQIAVHSGLPVHTHVGRAPVGVEDAEHHLHIRRAEATSPERIDHVSIPLLRNEQTHEPRQSCGKNRANPVARRWGLLRSTTGWEASKLCHTMP